MFGQNSADLGLSDGSNSNGLVLEAVYEEEVANTKYTADVRPLLELGKAIAGKKP